MTKKFKVKHILELLARKDMVKMLSDEDLDFLKDHARMIQLCNDGKYSKDVYPEKVKEGCDRVVEIAEKLRARVAQE